MIGVALGFGALMSRGRLATGFKALWEKRAFFLVILFMANLPDVDYIPGVLIGEINASHHGYTHTLGWIVAVAVASWLLWRKADRIGWAVFAILFAALASHLVADIFSGDGNSPYGIMALWPFTDSFTISPVTIFWSLRKATWSDVFQWYNVRAALYEALVVLPVLVAVLLFKRFAPASKKGEVGNVKLELETWNLALQGWVQHSHCPSTPCRYTNFRWISSFQNRSASLPARAFTRACSPTPPANRA